MENLPVEILSDVYSRLSAILKNLLSFPFQSFMDNLPINISLDIFTRLPAPTVLECKQVCKSWNNLISLDKPNFAAMHLLRHNHHNDGIVSSKVSPLGLIFLGQSLKRKATDNTEESKPLYYGEFDENMCIQNTLGSNNQYSMCGIKSLIGSCNGLICLAVNRMNYMQDRIQIWNPVTREHVDIQGFNENGDYPSYGGICSGFGYCFRNNEYKVVRILYSCFNSKITGDIQVYTLGVGSGWRNKGVINGSLRSQYGVFFNGDLHWLGANGKDIMVFNLLDEEFHALPPVPGLEHTCEYNSILGLFEGWLCISVCESHRSRCLDIWTYKNTSLKKNIPASDYNKDKSWSWCKEFSITPENSFPYLYTPFAVTKSGSVLLKSNADEKTLSCYDPKTATMRRIETGKFLQAIPHTNSFVSVEIFKRNNEKRTGKVPLF